MVALLGRMHALTEVQQSCCFLRLLTSSYVYPTRKNDFEYQVYAQTGSATRQPDQWAR